MKHREFPSAGLMSKWPEGRLALRLESGNMLQVSLVGGGNPTTQAISQASQGLP